MFFLCVINALSIGGERKCTYLIIHQIKRLTVNNLYMKLDSEIVRLNVTKGLFYITMGLFASTLKFIPGK